MPANPVAGVAFFLQCLNEAAAGFLERPVISAAIEKEVRQTAREKMFRRDPSRSGVVNQNTREGKLRSAKTEIHGGLFRLHHELGQIVADSEPRQNPVALPAPGNHLLLRDVGI